MLWTVLIFPLLTTQMVQNANIKHTTCGTSKNLNTKHIYSCWHHNRTPNAINTSVHLKVKIFHQIMHP